MKNVLRKLKGTLLDRESCMVDRLKTLVGTLELNVDVEDWTFWIHDNGFWSRIFNWWSSDWKNFDRVIYFVVEHAPDRSAKKLMKCVGRRSMRTRDLVWDPPPMGVLRDDKEVVLALFSCRYVAGGLEMAVLMAIKEAAKIVIELIQKENLFANIEGSLRRMAKVRIEVTNRGKNGMAEALAKAVVCALFWYSLAAFDSLPELIDFDSIALRNLVQSKTEQVFAHQSQDLLDKVGNKQSNASNGMGDDHNVLAIVLMTKGTPLHLSKICFPISTKAEFVESAYLCSNAISLNKDQAPSSDKPFRT
ncbi:hypothetical protein Gotri_019857 [Gossypium trilobum]|uniref:RNase H type-1 domain-containing protein n=1 Tax=Gossypium trilobum TaxID=34281 RepID=A0A7J9EEY3_9ROSI|nr:hypothetical protein [Gossypium trilobum]